MGNATLFANCASLILAIYGIAVLRKQPSPSQMVAVALAFGGAAMLMAQSIELSPGHFRGDSSLETWFHGIARWQWPITT